MAERIITENIERLNQEKTKAKTRLVGEKNKLLDLLQVGNTSKNKIKRYINKVKAEFSIIEKIFNKLKELSIFENIEQSSEEVEKVEKELEEMGVLVDNAIEMAELHIAQRLEKGELDSMLQSQSDINSVVESESRHSDSKQYHQSELSEASRRVAELHQEEIMKEEELTRNVAELELARKRTQEARQIASLIDARSRNTTPQSSENGSPRQTLPGLSNSINPLVNKSIIQPENTVKQTNLDSNATSFQTKSQFLRQPIPDPELSEKTHSLEGNQFQQSNMYPLQPTNPSPTNQAAHKAVRLKGVELPVFDGEDKSEYEPWKAAFMSAVDSADVAVNEKMLRLQSSLKGKPLKLVKDLGFSVHAYEKAKDKLEKKYGGPRRLQITTLTALKNWKRVQSKNLNELEEFLNVLDRTLIVLKDTGNHEGDIFGQSLNLISKEKLPEEDVQNYKTWLIEHSKEDNFETLVQWLELRVQIMEEAKEETKGLGSHKLEKNFEQKFFRKRERGFNTNSKSSLKCIVHTCKLNHPPWVCEEFRALPVANRKMLIERSKRCYRCLGVGHKAADCNRARRCGVSGCNSTQHNRLLHLNRDGPDASLSQNGGSSQEASETEQSKQVPGIENTAETRSYVNGRTDNVSLMVLPAVAKKGNRQLKVNVMLDPCSTASYVTEALAEELRLNGEFQELTIAGAGGSLVKKQSKQVSLIVESTNNKFSESVTTNVLDNITGDTPAFDWTHIKSKWPHLYSVPFEKIAKRKQIDILIGSDHPMFHHVLKEIHGSTPTDPIARLTHLGWVCFGPTQLENHRRKSRSHFTRTYRTSLVEKCPDQQLRQFWELEALGIKDNNEQTLDEKEAATKVSSSVVFIDGKYAVGVPWKKGEPSLKNNYHMALKRLENQERALRKKGSEAAQSYDRIIKDYEKKGYVKKTEKTEEENQWFLPHFAVIKDDRTTTKIRIVFDAAAKDSGKSLNDAIHSGPKLQNDVLNVLMRFRRAPIALSGDISEMFLQVGLLEDDRKYHRFLWRELDSFREPDVYEFQRLVFGNTASPYCAQFVVKKHSKDNEEIYPKAANSVSDAMYVDDVLDSCETPDDAIELRRQLSELLSCGNFRMRKWSSNNKSVLAEVPEEDRQPGVKIRENDQQPRVKVKALGVMWKSDKDVFTFNVELSEIKESSTKREVLSAISTLFDPMQLLSPFTIRAKIIMQDIWAAGIDWDDPLPPALLKRWHSWLAELQQLPTVEIPRCIRRPFPKEKVLHMFCDASKDAYSACGYLVCCYENAPSTSILITSKSRVAPVKSLSIPRLELMGAVISARLSRTILKSINVSRVVYWTDSTNVLYWVRNRSRKFKTFVANRVGEIQETTDPKQWRHVPGIANPADLATRGISLFDLKESKLWLEGPQFLLEKEENWPNRDLGTDSLSIDTSEESKSLTTQVTSVTDCKFINPENYSSFKRLIRVTAWLQRFISNCKRHVEDRELNCSLAQQEIKRAEKYWLKRAQTEGFMDERQKSLENLNIMKDEHNLLRLSGRLQHADLPFESKHPVVLPKKHPVTYLVIKDVHEGLGHGSGVEHALTELRCRFWVIKGRAAVREVINHCRMCKKRFNARPLHQMMAPLPRSRITSTMRAFERVGVDFGGPYFTKQGRGQRRAKRYLCLFTCLVTRGVHLEMAYGLDTNSFLNAFSRFVSRRGIPCYVLSDNGTNFVRGNKELKELVKQMDQEKIIRETSGVGEIQWQFNPPTSPHFGGVFEIMIKCAKKAIRGVLGNAEVTDEELLTAICGAESLLSSRPFTYVSLDSNDLYPLTPNHFMYGQAGGKFAEEATQEETYNPHKRWHRIQQLIGQVWRRWRKELLPSLNTRKKWFSPTRNVQVGDVVLIIEPGAHRCDWPLGRVLEVYPGEDDLVRVVKVRSNGKEYLRPIHRMCPLDYA